MGRQKTKKQLAVTTHKLSSIMCALPGTLTKLAEVRIVAEHALHFINTPVQAKNFVDPTQIIIQLLIITHLLKHRKVMTTTEPSPLNEASETTLRDIFEAMPLGSLLQILSTNVVSRK